MRYEYYCRACGLTFRCDVRDSEVCCLRCDTMARRRWGFHYQPTFGGGFSPATGGYVPTTAALRSELSKASDLASAPATVYDGHGEAHTVERPPSRYVPVDPRDKEACGVTSEGLPETYDALRRAGNHPAADRLRKLID